MIIVLNSRALKGGGEGNLIEEFRERRRGMLTTESALHPRS